MAPLRGFSIYFLEIYKHDAPIGASSKWANSYGTRLSSREDAISMDKK